MADNGALEGVVSHVELVTILRNTLPENSDKLDIYSLDTFNNLVTCMDKYPIGFEHNLRLNVRD